MNKRFLTFLLMAVCALMGTTAWADITTTTNFTVDENGVYHVKNAQGMKDFANTVNAGNEFQSQTIVLDADIDLSSVCGPTIGTWVPIGEFRNKNAAWVGSTSATPWFCGTFDGNGKTISNLYIDGTKDGGGFYEYLALFGGIHNGSTVKNFTLNGTVQNVSNGAAVVGRILNGGTIEDVTNNATVNVKLKGAGIVASISNDKNLTDASETYLRRCTNNGNVTSVAYMSGSSDKPQVYVSGIATHLSGSSAQIITIEDCKNNGSLKGTNDEATGSYCEAAGIASYIYTSVTVIMKNCVNTGSVDCERTNLNFAANAGGLAGEVCSTGKLTVTGGSNSGLITSSDYVGGIVGKLASGNIVTISNATYDNVDNRNTDADRTDCVFGKYVGYAGIKSVTTDEGDRLNLVIKENSTGVDIYTENRVGQISGYEITGTTVASSCTNELKTGTTKNIAIRKGATFTLDTQSEYKGLITVFDGATLNVTGTAKISNIRVMEGGTVSVSAAANIDNITNNGTLTIEKGTLGTLRNPTGTATINGGTFTGGVSNNATMTVNAGTFSGQSGNAIYNNGANAKLVINGGSFAAGTSVSANNNQSPSIHNVCGGDVIINDGTFQSIWNGYNPNNVDQKITVNGGTYTGNKKGRAYTINNDGKTGNKVMLAGGTFNVDPTTERGTLASAYYIVTKPSDGTYIVTRALQKTEAAASYTINGSAPVDGSAAKAAVETVLSSANSNVQKFADDVYNKVTVADATNSYVQVKMSAATVDANSVVTAMTFDVKPVYVNASSQVVDIQNSEIKSGGSNPSLSASPMNTENSEGTRKNCGRNAANFFRHD